MGVCIGLTGFVLGCPLLLPGPFQKFFERYVQLGWYSTQLFQLLGEMLVLFKRKLSSSNHFFL